MKLGAEETLEMHSISHLNIFVLTHDHSETWPFTPKEKHALIW
jgi:hypothetical protein